MSEKLNDVKDAIEVPIMLDKERNLRFDMNAFSSLEDEYETVEVALKEMEKGKMKAVRAVLWAGLVHEDENLTPKDVGRHITFNRISELAQTLGEAIKKSMPRQDPNDQSTQPEPDLEKK